ncbi:MAG: hypothetical protein JOZ42_09980 [Acetobacteraceae bacterium]|nr:hypothetical protein [Acetobacteraceae bacterium]
MKRGLRLIVLLPLASACGSTEVALPYAPATATVMRDNRPVVALGSVADERGEPDPRWIGTIRGGFGNPLKTIHARDAVAIEVRKAFEDALAARGLLASAGGQQYLLQVRILDFNVNQTLRREADVKFAITLSHGSAAPVYADEIHVNRVSGGVLAFDKGVFSNPQDLRAVMNSAMNQAIDEALDKPNFRAALGARA